MTNGSIRAMTSRWPRAAASRPRPSRIGHGRRFIRCSGWNASTGSSSSIRLAARSATTRVTWSGASRPVIRANSATSRATVRVPSIRWASASSSGVRRR
ncbi:MAG: hypothetical protein AUI10_08750 [Actinobacteria bacterium 13_2_20CM_2_72_6]|nr:MAG: hypothetical protein AUI10_08750 [Actinobacteria bacterium 13_2_20CM_2_72_6]